MKFNKMETLRNLKTLEHTIALSSGSYRKDSEGFSIMRPQAWYDILFLRGLMDDIECDRITEFPMEERTNIMSGETFLEEEDTPYFCSPSSETFWSM